MIAENTFYVYGGIRRDQQTKIHICDDKADPLCGVNSFWMEAGEPIDERGFIRGQEHFEPIKEGTGVCKMCLKKWEAAKK